MGVKWTAERDQTLLVLVLQLSQGTLDYKTIAENWPDSAGEKPTPKALSEHIAKLKKDLAGIASPNKSIASPRAKAGGITTTPTKNRVTKPRGKKAQKVTEVEDDDEEEEVSEEVKAVKKKLFGKKIEDELKEEEEDEEYAI